jgi:beta-phosphoglucomutase family hydrolase
MKNANFAIIFDMDGVLVDNKHLHRKAWVKFCQGKGCNLTDEGFDQVGFGKDNKDYLTIFLGREVTDEEVIKFGEEKEQIYREMAKEEIKPVPGLRNILISIRNNPGIKTAIASSSPISNIQFTIQTLNINGFFDQVADGNSVENGKPEPDIYLKTAKKLEVKPSDCLVFEDSLFGVESALNAGMKVIALTTSHSASELQSYNLQMIIKDFREISLEYVKGILGR